MSRVTLTFDNGPDPESTPAVLDVLRRHDVAAHFFVLGKNLLSSATRELVARARDEGHRVGNHSFTHAVPLGEDPRPDAPSAEIASTQRILEPIVYAPRRFRPFGRGGLLGPHLLSPGAVAHLTANEYSLVLWTSVPRDWEDPDGWPARALEDCASQEHAVIVLHDVPGACLDRLDDFLAALRARGVDVVPELPLACTPIVDGRVVGDLTGIVGEPNALSTQEREGGR